MVPSGDQRGWRPLSAIFFAPPPFMSAVHTAPLCQSLNAISPSESWPPMLNGSEVSIVVFQPSVVVTRTRTSVPLRSSEALAVSELPVTPSPSVRQVDPPSVERATKCVSASPSASAASQAIVMSEPSATFAPAAGAVTSKVGAAPVRARCHSTSPPRRMRRLRAAPSAGTRSENAASAVTACSSPVAAFPPIGPRSLLTPKRRVWSTAPAASSCSKTSGPSPSPASGSPSTSAMSPARTLPSALTVPVSDSVRCSAAAMPCCAVAPSSPRGELGRPGSPTSPWRSSDRSSCARRRRRSRSA